MNALSIELTYIIDCLAYKLFPDSEFPVPAEDINWERLYALIETHRLSGLFFALGQNADAWPADFKHRLRMDGYQYSLYGDQCSQSIKMFLEAMNSLGVGVIVLKGWAHIQTIYDQDYSQRLCEDIDVLVHPKDVDVVEDMLRSLGYSHEMEGWSGYDRRYNNSTRYFVPGADVDFANTFSVGLHWGLIHIPSYDPQQINVDSLFANALRLDVMGVPVLQLSPEHEVVYLCGHLGLHHRFDGALFRYYELASCIVNNRVAMDWQKIMDISIHWRHILPVQHILRRVIQLWPGVIPLEVLNLLSKVKPEYQERFVDFWITSMNDLPVYDHLLTWITFPRIWERPLIALQDVFPSKEYMIARYGNAPLGFWPLLYIRRFFRALRFLKS
jgi:hypothetical protein